MMRVEDPVFISEKYNDMNRLIIERPLRIYCDNEPTVPYSYNNKSCGATKFIDF
jgi:hypothetical protein